MDIASRPVLIVEDNGPTRDALGAVLEIRGYETVECTDGLDALSWLRAGGMPCVIILDVRMPNMDGMTFQRALRADPRWINIPVVIYSAVPPADGEGATAILRKGTGSPEMLLSLVQAAARSA